MTMQMKRIETIIILVCVISLSPQEQPCHPVGIKNIALVMDQLSEAHLCMHNYVVVHNSYSSYV